MALSAEQLKKLRDSINQGGNLGVDSRPAVAQDEKDAEEKKKKDRFSGIKGFFGQ